MRYFNRGSFREQVGFLRRQFLQDGDLPFTNVLSEEIVKQALLASISCWLDRIFSPLVTLWVFLGQVLRGCLDSPFTTASALFEVVFILVVRKHGSSHPVDHRDVDPRLAVVGMLLVILAQPSIAPKPAECPFDDPSSRQVYIPLGS